MGMSPPSPAGLQRPTADTPATDACSKKCSISRRKASIYKASAYALAVTASKISWIEEFVNDLLEPVGRARRAKAAEALRNGRLFRGARPLALGTRLTHRRGWVLEAITKVLEVHGEPMQAIAIHAAVEELLGEPVCWSSVKNCLSEGVRLRSGRFERVGHGRYRLGQGSLV